MVNKCPFCKKNIAIEEAKGDLREELLKDGLPIIRILPHKGANNLCTTGFYPAALAAI